MRVKIIHHNQDYWIERKEKSFEVSNEEGTCFPGIGMALYHLLGEKIIADFGIQKWRIPEKAGTWLEFADERTKEWFITGPGRLTRWEMEITDGELPPEGIPIDIRTIIFLAQLGKNKSLEACAYLGNSYFEPEQIEAVSLLFGDKSLAKEMKRAKAIELLKLEKNLNTSGNIYEPKFTRSLPGPDLRGMNENEFKRLLFSQTEKRDVVLETHLLKILPNLLLSQEPNILLHCLKFFQKKELPILPIIENLKEATRETSYSERFKKFMEHGFNRIYRPKPSDYEENKNNIFLDLAPFFFDPQKILEDPENVEMPLIRKAQLNKSFGSPYGTTQVTPATPGFRAVYNMSQGLFGIGRRSISPFLTYQQTEKIWERHTELSDELLFGSAEKENCILSCIIPGDEPVFKSILLAERCINCLFERKEHSLLIRLLKERKFIPAITPGVVAMLMEKPWNPEAYNAKKEFQRKLIQTIT